MQKLLFIILTILSLGYTYYSYSIEKQDKKDIKTAEIDSSKKDKKIEKSDAVIPAVTSSIDNSKKQDKSKFKKSSGLYGIFYLRDEPENDYYMLNISPLYWHVRDGNTSWNMFLPFYYGEENEKEKSSYTHIIPFYFGGKSKESDWDLVFPFFYYHNDLINKDLGITTFLFYFNQTTRGITFDLFPLIYYSNKKEKSSFTLVPLISYRSNTAKQFSEYSSFLFHFYNSYSKDDAKDFGMLLYLYWWYSDKLNTTKTFFPVFHYDRSIITDKNMNIESEDELFLSIPFIYWSSTDQNKKTISSGGTISYLYWWDKNNKNGSFFNMLFPLYMYSVNEKEKSSTFISPIFTFVTKNDSSTGEILYFYWWNTIGNQKFNTLIPFYLYQEDTIKKEYSLYTILFGFDKSIKENASAGEILYLYWWNTYGNLNYNFAIPFYYYEKDKKKKESLFISLPYSSKTFDNGETARTSLFLYWWGTIKDFSYSTFLPLYYYSYDGKSKEENFYSLLFSYHREVNRGWAGNLLWVYWWDTIGDVNSNLLYPLYYYRSKKSTEESSFYSIPYSYYSKGKEGSKGTAGLLYWWDTFGKEDTYTLLPIFHYRTNDEEKENAFYSIPFSYKHKKDVGWKGNVALLYWWNTLDSVHSNTLVPIYHYEEDTNKKTTSFYSLPYSEKSTPNGSKGTVGLLYWWDNIGQVDMNMFFPAYLYRTNEKSKESWFYSLLFSYYSPPEKGWFGNVAMLYWWDTIGDVRSSMFLPFYIDRKNTKTDERWFYSLPFSYYNDPKGGWGGNVCLLYWWNTLSDYKFYMLYPLFFYGNDTKNDNSMFISLPFSIANDKRSKTSLLEIAVLYWNIDSPSEKMNMLLPFYFYYASKKNTDDIFTIIPLLYFHYDTSRESVSYQIPFYWDFENKGISRTTIVFPLYWDFEDKVKNKYNEYLFPLWYNIKKPTSHFSMLFPFYWQYSDKEDSSYGILGLFWSNRDKVTGHKTVALEPIFTLETGKNYFFISILKNLWAYESIDNNSQTTLLWLINF